MYDEGRKLNWRAPHWNPRDRGDGALYGGHSLLGEYADRNSPSLPTMGSPSTPPLVPLPPILAPGQWPTIGQLGPEIPSDMIETTLLGHTGGQPRFADIATDISSSYYPGQASPMPGYPMPGMSPRPWGQHQPSSPHASSSSISAINQQPEHQQQQQSSRRSQRHYRGGK
jgi:hypothetical protein